jgi:hypothetical protein
MDSPRSRTRSQPYLARRQLPHSPELVLDAPSVRNDYYSTLLDWSRLGTIAVGLDHQAYLWNQVIRIDIGRAARNNT